MSAPAVSAAAAVKKKHVRFARTEEDNDDQEEDTLFDKRTDAMKSAQSFLKAGRRRGEPASDTVAFAGRSRSPAGSGGAVRWPVTAALCTSFLGLGMSIAVLGPTFEDLAINVNKNISNISYIFVGRSLGYIGGSVVGGVLFDCMNHHLLLGSSMLVTAFGMFAIPFCKKALLLTVFMSSIGISMGFLDTGGNVLILNTWGDQAGPHMQALHFSFAVGAFASPIIAKLLFGSVPPAGTNISIEARDSQAAELPPETTDASKALTVLRFAHSKSSSLKSMWAYIVIGAFILLVSLLFFILYSRSSPSRDRAKASPEKHLVARHHNALIIMLFFFFFCYVGAEVAYGSFIFTYAKDFAHMDETQAAGLNSVFWGTFAAARGLAIFCAACMHPGTMILLSLVGCTMSSLFLSLFSKNRISLWSGTAFYGASMATTFPSGISWVEQYTTVTGRSTAVFVVGAALGEMVFPAVVGLLLGKTQDQPFLMYTALGTSTMTAILFPVMYKLATSHSSEGRKLREGGRTGEDGEDRKALLDSGANEEEEEEEEEDEAEQWNDADFEVIEMDDASLMNSAHDTYSPPRVTPVSETSAETTTLSSTTPPTTTPPAAASPDSSRQPAGPSSPSPSHSSPAFLGGSPRKKLLLNLDREKKD
ncbi:sodium-dependent glucose transporter 1 [Amia ocellicauda]|uniref:sodium-dependent glucose transporter 1 n=1 Tax=Amia ocellicauda TaxID=2972642 RepID=UPI003464C484